MGSDFFWLFERNVFFLGKSSPRTSDNWGGYRRPEVGIKDLKKWFSSYKKVFLKNKSVFSPLRTQSSKDVVDA